MMLKSLVIMTACMFVFSANAVSLSEMQVYGSSIIKDESEDMWDKKKQAIYDAKKRATFKLARRVFKPEMMTGLEPKIKKLVLPYSSRYLVSSTLVNHGPEEHGDYKTYNARVKFKYSIENFKKLLRNKGFASTAFQKYKVAAFIEVMDIGAVKTFSWWNEKKPSLHPVLKPLQAKLASALGEEGYELLPMKYFGNSVGMKEMSRLMGAQYYVSGFIKIDKIEETYKVKAGIFNFHEALSQKLVSQVDLKKFGKSTSEDEVQTTERGIASVEKRKDLLKDAFKGAVKTMNANENVEHLSHGVANLKFDGVSSPAEMLNIKRMILTNLKEDIAALTERNIEKGAVTFVAKTQLNPSRLLRLMNSSNMGLGMYRGVMKEDGKTLYFTLPN